MKLFFVFRYLPRQHNPFTVRLLRLVLLMVLLWQISIPMCASAATQASQEPTNVIVRDTAASAARAWEGHKLAILGVLVLCLAETALLIILFLQRRRRRSAEESLRHKTEELDQFFDVSLDLLCIANADGYFERLNPAFERTLGYSREELTTRSFLDFVHPDDREATREAIATLASQKSLTTFSNRYLSKDGTVRWVEWNAAPVGNRIYAAARDVTERKRAEKVLDERLKFERLLSDLSARFVNVAPDRVDSETEQGLRQVIEFFEVERCGLLETLGDKNSWQVTHAAVMEGVPPVPLRTELPVSIYPWTYDKLTRKGEVVTFSRLNDVPAEADVDRQTWTEWGIRSALYIPIAIKDPVAHTIAIDSIRSERVWPEEFIPRLRLLGEILVNALERKRIRLELEERLRFEQLTSDLSGRFVNLPSDEVDSEINKWLRSITEFFEADRCSLGLFSEDATRLVRFLEYHFPGAQPAAEYVSKEQMPWYFEQLLQGNPVVMNGIKDLPPEAEKERGFCVVRGMKSVLSVPMASGGKILGSCALVLTRAERIWPEELVQRFRFVSEVFANALARKRADQALRESEERLSLAAEEWQTTFDSIADVIMILDREHRVVRVNVPAGSFFGEPLERLVGKSCYALMHGTNEPLEMCPLTKAKVTKRHEEAELYDEQRQAWFQVSVDPILDDSGQIIRAVHTIKDITARKKAESEAFAARRELLRTERLLRMGELTASLAHELNQPLTSILSNARAALRFIQSGNLDMDEFKEILEDIAQDDKRASDIIRSLRSMVKQEAGERKWVSMGDVLRESVSLFHSESVIRNIRVEINVTEPLAPVMIDKVLILQVLVNLLMNAAESMDLSASADREIGLATWATDDRTVIVAVRDAGPGIEAEELSKIFDPFFTTKRSGLGMGLSLSRSIIEGHGGRIWAENNHPDRGVTFYFELPTARQ